MTVNARAAAEISPVRGSRPQASAEMVIAAPITP
jgi:hypothetical protein